MDIIRRCFFRPYRKGAGPTFSLVVWDTGKYDRRGVIRLGYRLAQDGEEIFRGEDFSPSPMHGIGSDEAIRGLMGFLTLRPEDTDPDYFEKYTEIQLSFCRTHAEALSAEVSRRFGDD